ncbi:hypothetical protein J8273_3865 [Carpediemonas membranifera]|uniref:Uncharacterized protein n=1 Tax=Carpediemonas membranifera TaxID=201153 RepID=A0A8J6BYK9_9EUKA|nr:hypothetical protein J8273_3865 [Carpediemonas membranifera]|eukprot:KAG9394611.1 hypothetical protein J8273_3865 [Carpediemonas membranifera]
MYNGIGGFQKQSIMNRPIRAPSTKNETTLEKEYMREQRRLELIREKQEEREYERLRALYGTEEDKREIQARLKSEIDALVDARKSLDEQEKMEEERFKAEFEDQIKFAEFIEQDHNEARKEYERYVLEENLRLEEAAKRAKDEERDMEVEEDIRRPDFFKQAFMRSFR